MGYGEGRGNRDKGIEKKLLNHGDASKIIDYIETVVNSDLARSDIWVRGRWREAEKYIFRDTTNASRYYGMLQDKLTAKDKKEIEVLGKSIPSRSKPVEPLLPTSISVDARNIRVAFHRKRVSANERIRRIRRGVEIDKRGTQRKLLKAERKRSAKYDKMQAAASKALKDVEAGKPIEKIVSNLWDVGYSYYKGRFYDETPEESPLKQFIVDLIAYYNKGFVTGKKFKSSRRGRKRKRGRRGRRRWPGRGKGTYVPYLYSADAFIMDPTVVKDRSKRSGYAAKKRKKIKAKVAGLAAFADRKVKSRKRLRRNPRGYRRNSAQDSPHYHSGPKVIVVSDIEIVLTSHFQRRWEGRIGGRITLPLVEIVKALKYEKIGRYKVIITVKGPEHSGLAWLMVKKESDYYVIKTIATSPLHSGERFVLIP